MWNLLLLSVLCLLDFCLICVIKWVSIKWLVGGFYFYGREMDYVWYVIIYRVDRIMYLFVDLVNSVFGLKDSL